ncbi:MAG TPA: Holliday junction branch migration protein RuvA [Actinomycetota bacterium]|nr:Holliday junction branch migration protein RuvA [Actinomycetota bacterium]
MIAALEGTVAERSADRVVISAGGIGYEVLVPASTLAALPPTGRRGRLMTHLLVRDDALVLYGFATPAERELFLLLLGVNGVGPKAALAVLSVLTPEACRRAILDGDADVITIVPGIGKKVAARIVLDLKEKMGGEVELPGAGPVAEVREALLAMGLSLAEVHEAVAGLEPDGQPVEELLRRALQQVGSR